MKLRKKDMELTTKDLSKYPVWEFAYGEGGQETKIKPTTLLPPYDISQNRYLIRATFTLNNGQKECGYIKPINNKNNIMGHLPSVDLNYVLLTHFGNIYFWFGINKPKRRQLDQFYQWLDLTPDKIFPILVQSDIEIVNGIGNGIIDGFMYCEEENVEDFFHMKSSEVKIVF
jgi:hypothetical protein